MVLICWFRFLDLWSVLSDVERWNAGPLLATLKRTQVKVAGLCTNADTEAY